MRKPACDTCHIAGLLPFFHPFEDLPVPYVVVFDDGNSHFFNLIGRVSTKQLITVVDRTAVVVAEVDRMAVAEAGRKAAEVDRKTAEELPIVLADQKSGAGYYAGSLAETFFRYHDAYRLEDGSIDRTALFETLSQKMHVEIDIMNDADGSEGDVGSVVAAMSGAAYVLLAVSLSVLPLVNEAFTRPGVFERSIGSPYKSSKRVLELYLGSGIVVFGFSLFTIHRHATAGQIGRVALNYSAYVLCVLSIGNIVMNLTRNRAAISAISTVFSLGLSFISGAFVPQELVSESVLNVSKVFPMYYFIRANRNSLVWEEMVPDILMQLVFFTVYVVIAFVLQRFAGRSRKTIKTATSLTSDIGA
jgi:hypothetical protein